MSGEQGRRNTLPGFGLTMNPPRASTSATPAQARRVLVLQGGGALGSYQAGAYQALCRHDFEPDWIAGISIGAINAAIIAGNAREKRMERLKEFWDMVSAPVPWRPELPNDYARSLFNEGSAATVATFGVPGFFTPRFPPTEFWPTANPEGLSYYDTSPLRATLERLVDFDRINSGITRLSVGAVNVATGNFVYFDNAQQEIHPEHIMPFWRSAMPAGLRGNWRRKSRATAGCIVRRIRIWCSATTSKTNICARCARSASIRARCRTPPGTRKLAV